MIRVIRVHHDGGFESIYAVTRNRVLVGTVYYYSVDFGWYRFGDRRNPTHHYHSKTLLGAIREIFKIEQEQLAIPQPRNGS